MNFVITQDMIALPTGWAKKFVWVSIGMMLRKNTNEHFGHPNVIFVVVSIVIS